MSRWGENNRATAEMGEVISNLVQVTLLLGLVVRDVEGDLLPRWVVQEDPRCADQTDGLFEQCKALVHLGCSPCCIEDGIALNHDALTLVWERVPDLFREKRHERMQEAHRGFERLDEGLSGPWSFRTRRVLKCGLDQFEVPVTVLMPDELVQRARGAIEPIGFQLGRHRLDRLIQATQNPAVGKGALSWSDGSSRPIEIHEAETRRVPDLVCKIAVAFDPFLREFDVAPRRGHRRERESEGISAE